MKFELLLKNFLIRKEMLEFGLKNGSWGKDVESRKLELEETIEAIKLFEKENKSGEKIRV